MSFHRQAEANAMQLAATRLVGGGWFSGGGIRKSVSLGTFCTNRKYHRPYGPQVAYPYASAVCDASALLCCYASRPPRRGHCLPLRKKCRSAFGVACFFVCAVRCAAARDGSALRSYCATSTMETCLRSLPRRSNLTLGTVYIKELSAPKGYMLDSTAVSYTHLCLRCR